MSIVVRAPGRVTALVRVALTALAVVLVAGVLVRPASGEEPAASPAQELVALLDAERDAHGTPALRVAADLEAVAQDWASTLASTGQLAPHPTLGDAVDHWVRLAEHVGSGPDAPSVHAGLMRLPDHRANVLDPELTEVGVAAAPAEGRLYVVQVFRAPEVPGQAPAPVVDAPGPAPTAEPTTAPTAAPTAPPPVEPSRPVATPTVSPSPSPTRAPRPTPSTTAAPEPPVVTRTPTPPPLAAPRPSPTPVPPAPAPPAPAPPTPPQPAPAPAPALPAPHAPVPAPAWSPPPAPAPAPAPPAPAPPAQAPAPAPAETSPVTALALVCPSGLPAAGFADVAAQSTHRRSIDCAAWWALVKGMGAGRYEPQRDVTRAQMATFLSNLVRAQGPVAPSPRDHFGDDGGSVHSANIDLLAELGVVKGNGRGSFEPDRPVTRAQMATFLVGVHEHLGGQPLPAGQAPFADVAGVHAGSVGKLYALGVTTGVDAASYGSGLPVTRGQLASFIMRTAELLARGGDLPLRG